MLSLFLLGLVLGALVLARFEREVRRRADGPRRRAARRIERTSPRALCGFRGFSSLHPTSAGSVRSSGTRSCEQVRWSSRRRSSRAWRFPGRPGVLAGRRAARQRRRHRLRRQHVRLHRGSARGGTVVPSRPGCIPLPGGARNVRCHLGGDRSGPSRGVAIRKCGLRWPSLAPVRLRSSVRRLRFAEAFSRPQRSRDTLGPTLFYREGATDTVAVVSRGYGFRDPDAKSVLVNGISMTATVKPVWRYMAAEGHLPALLAPSPRAGLVICVGTGITLGALASHDTVTAIDAVDLSESVLAALPVFDRENRSASRDPKVNIVHADGRHFLELTDRRYGVITVEPPRPSSPARSTCTRSTSTSSVARILSRAASSPSGSRSTHRVWLLPRRRQEHSSRRSRTPSSGSRRFATPCSSAPTGLCRLGRDRLRAAYAAPLTKESLDLSLPRDPGGAPRNVPPRSRRHRAVGGNADVITDDRPWIEILPPLRCQHERPGDRHPVDARTGRPR